MAREIGDVEIKAPQARNFSRREVLVVMGATAAVSLVGGPGEESAAAQPSAHIQNTNSRSARIDAKPETTSIDIAKSAVIVVDMQNDFGAKGGMFDLAGIAISGIRKAIGPTARVLETARDAGIKIVYLKMAFRPDLSDLGAPDSPNRLRHLRHSESWTALTASPRASSDRNDTLVLQERY